MSNAPCEDPPIFLSGEVPAPILSERELEKTSPHGWRATSQGGIRSFPFPFHSFEAKARAATTRDIILISLRGRKTRGVVERQGGV